MAADELIVSTTVAVGVVVVGAVLFSLRSARQVLAFLVGVTGVLMTAQVGGKVHAFTVVTIAWFVVTRPDAHHQRWGRVAALLCSAGFLASTVLFGEFVNSPTLGLQLMALSVPACAIALRADERDVELIAAGALTGISVGSAVALLQVAGVVPLGELALLDIRGVARPNGIWPEPDWLGLHSALGLVLAWRLRLSSTVRTVLLTINGLPFLLAFARAAWVGLAGAVLVAAVVGRLRRQRRQVDDTRRKSLTTLSVTLVVVLVVSPGLRSDLGRRVGTLVSADTQDVSGRARLQQLEGLLTLAESAPPFGHGLSTSGRVGVSGRLYLGIESDNNVASNWLLGLWVDGAFLAVPLILLLLFFAIWGAGSIGGLMLLVVLVNSLFSNALFVPVTWLCLGLCMRTVPSPWVWGPRTSRPRLTAPQQTSVPGRPRGRTPPSSRAVTVTVTVARCDLTTGRHRVEDHPE